MVLDLYDVFGSSLKFIYFFGTQCPPHELEGRAHKVHNFLTTSPEDQWSLYMGCLFVCLFT